MSATETKKTREEILAAELNAHNTASHDHLRDISGVNPSFFRPSNEPAPKPNAFTATAALLLIPFRMPTAALSGSALRMM